MHVATKVALAAAAVLALFAVMTALHRPAAPSAGASPTEGPPLTAEQRAGGLKFDGVSPQDQQVIRSAIASARPEARRLIDIVDGAVTVKVGDTGATAAGWTQGTQDGYEMAIDLAKVSQTLGPRGVVRTVLHEFGHVVDFALVPTALKRQLDAEIPQGYSPCESGQNDAACAARAERFAETFSKWATGDIGAALEIGYRVPPPSVSLEQWGRPLAQLGSLPASVSRLWRPGLTNEQKDFVEALRTSVSASARPGRSPTSASVTTTTPSRSRAAWPSSAGTGSRCPRSTAARAGPSSTPRCSSRSTRAAARRSAATTCRSSPPAR